ncbi:MAG: hypothetical protein Q7R59_01620 [bacterium]|nr:hypothetical protein [bacterium]
MPPIPQPIVTTSPSRSPLIPILITIVVIVVVLLVAWYAKLISLGIPIQTSTSSAGQAAVESTAASTIFLTSGTYALVGRGAGQTANYAGTVKIVWRENTPNIFDLVWNITSGQAQYGVGILKNGILSVSYYEAPDDSVSDVGVVSYEVIDASNLKGEWTSVKGGTAGVEQLTLQTQI